MPEGAFIPPWLQPANPAEHLAQGYRIGIALGAQQAEQAFREQQSMRQQQEDAERRAQWEAEFGLRAKQAADKAAAIQEYQAAIAGGMDPVIAITRFGPRMQEPGAAMAAALRQSAVRPSTGLTGGLVDIGGGYKAFQTGPSTRTLVRPSDEATSELMPATTPDGTPIPDTWVTRKGNVVHTPKAPKPATPERPLALGGGEYGTVVRDTQGNPVGIRKIGVELTPEEKAIADKDAADKAKPAPLKQLWDKIVGARTAVTQALDPAPRDPAKRVVDKVYRLPKGLFRWTGKGWLPASQPVTEPAAEPVEE